MSHLLSMGHRRTAFVGGDPNVSGFQERMRGHRAAPERASVGFLRQYACQAGGPGSPRWLPRGVLDCGVHTPGAAEAMEPAESPGRFSLRGSRASGMAGGTPARLGYGPGEEPTGNSNGIAAGARRLVSSRELVSPRTCWRLWSLPGVAPDTVTPLYSTVTSADSFFLDRSRSVRHVQALEVETCDTGEVPGIPAQQGCAA